MHDVDGINLDNFDKEMCLDENNENNCDDLSSRNVRRRKIVSVKGMKDLARSGKLEGSLKEISCDNVNYYVEFPIEDDVEGGRRSIGGEVQKELVENLQAVALKKKEEIKRGKKVRTGTASNLVASNAREVSYGKEDGGMSLMKEEIRC